jgi:hypothetical protein
MKTKTWRNPRWWDQNHDSAWERIKAAFRRDWDQTKHDFGGDEPDTDQDVDDTVAQAAGKQPIPPRGTATYEENENAYRFGYGARRHYGKRYNTWNNQVEEELRRDWDTMDTGVDWPRYRSAVREGWEYEERPVGR